jgi:23S rRNA (uracil1939-C5)-methyltransferase
MVAAEPCPHRPPCPGCPRYGAPGIDPRAAARLADLAGRAGAPAPGWIAGARFGFRTRARLVVRGRAASPKIGIFQAGSHRIVDIPRCRVHHPLVNRVAAAAREAIRATGLAPYADGPDVGLVRALQVVVERPSTTAQVVLVANGQNPEPFGALARELGGRLGAALHSLWWNGNPGRTNVVLGPHWHLWQGPRAVRERIGGVDVFYPPGAFGQSHLDLADVLDARVQDAVPAGSRVVELHAGCGPIGLGLLRGSASVLFVESAPAAIEGLGLGLAARPAGERSRAGVRAVAAAEALEALDGADVVIADPPRKGIEPAVLEVLCAAPPRRLIYVACDLDSFEVQAAQLLASGRLRLVELVAFDLFPNTEHVETLACFERTG